MGRPSTYNLELASAICTRISNGEPLRQICMDPKMPNQNTVYVWIARHEDFREMYTRARSEQADTLADEIVAIADEQPAMLGDPESGFRIDSAYVQWQRNRVDARKWVAAKLKPRKYGERLGLEGVEGGAPIKTEETSSSRLFELLKNLEMSKRVSD